MWGFGLAEGHGMMMGRRWALQVARRFSQTIQAGQGGLSCSFHAGSMCRGRTVCSEMGRFVVRCLVVGVLVGVA